VAGWRRFLTLEGVVRFPSEPAPSSADLSERRSFRYELQTCTAMGAAQPLRTDCCRLLGSGARVGSNSPSAFVSVQHRIAAETEAQQLSYCLLPLQWTASTGAALPSAGSTDAVGLAPLQKPLQFLLVSVCIQ
jgi:hypothetical protein